VRRFLRQMFDINTMYSDDSGGWRRWIYRLLLFGAGSGAGWLIWRLVDPASAGDRSFLERMVTNVYVWACLILTGVYWLLDRRRDRA
jgi:hypothetical protein